MIFASVFWGFGFIASIWALEGMGPIWMTSIRFIIAVVMLDLLYRFRVFGEPLSYSWTEFKNVVLPGFFLFGLLGFQTWGLKYTSATRSGFITVLYVLFIPVFEKIFLKTKVRKILLLWIALALFGTALICKALTRDGVSPEFLSSFNLGDLLTLLAALCSAAHFIVVNTKMGTVSSPVKFHIYQSVWVIIFATLVGAWCEGFSWLNTLSSGLWTPKIWIGLLHLGILSSGIAFLIQVRAQRFLGPSTTGMLVLLESPWAMTFSVLLLHEMLTALQIVGAGFILFAALAESWNQMRVERISGLTQ